MANHPNRKRKTFTLRALIAETYADDETKYYGYEDRGNGSAFAAHVRRYDDQADAEFGDVEVTACKPIKAENDSTAEFYYCSEWQDGPNGYQFRLLF